MLYICVLVSLIFLDFDHLKKQFQTYLRDGTFWAQAGLFAAQACFLSKFEKIQKENTHVKACIGRNWKIMIPTVSHKFGNKRSLDISAVCIRAPVDSKSIYVTSLIHKAIPSFRWSYTSLISNKKLEIIKAIIYTFSNPYLHWTSFRNKTKAKNMCSFICLLIAFIPFDMPVNIWESF